MKILRTKRTSTAILALVAYGMCSVFALTTWTGNKIIILNASTMNIIKVLVSADGEDYESINVGRGIRPGKSRAFPINESNQPCDLQIKVMYADRSETAPVRVNVCEKDVSVEFK